MLKTNVKAFFKYKEYRKYTFGKLAKKDIYKSVNIILIFCITITLLINIRWSKNIEILNKNYISSDFSLEKFLEKNYFNKSTNNLVVDQNNINLEPIENKNNKEQYKIQFKEEKDKRSEYEEKYNEVIQALSQLEDENRKLNQDNIELQNLLKMAASEGIKPRNYRTAPTINSRSGVLRGEYLGKFTITSYTPSKVECGNDKGLTYSGHPIVPGITVAVDTSYWPIGTIFYVEGLGYVIAMDTGAAIKGKYRMDFAVFDRDFAKKIGKREFNVYLIEKGNDCVRELNFN